MSKKVRPIHGEYLNGLERTGIGAPEVLLEAYLWARGIRITHAQVPWHDGTSFPEILRHRVAHTQEALQKYGRYVLFGASAGGSLALNTFHEVRKQDPDAKLGVICFSAWVQVGDPQELRRVVMEREHPSQASIDCVYYCDDVTIPGLSDADKTFIRINQPAGDQVVPRDFMLIDGVTVVPVSAERHVKGIVEGIIHVPPIVDGLPL